MATGENFTRIYAQRQEANKSQLKVDKKTEQKIKYEIKILQEELKSISEDDNLTDEEYSQKSMEINEKTHALIDSMYETKEEIKKRLTR